MLKHLQNILNTYSLPENICFCPQTKKTVFSKTANWRTLTLESLSRHWTESLSASFSLMKYWRIAFYSSLFYRSRTWAPSPLRKILVLQALSKFPWFPPKELLSLAVPHFIHTFFRAHWNEHNIFVCIPWLQWEQFEDGKVYYFFFNNLELLFHFLLPSPLIQSINKFHKY